MRGKVQDCLDYEGVLLSILSKLSLSLPGTSGLLPLLRAHFQKEILEAISTVQCRHHFASSMASWTLLECSCHIWRHEQNFWPYLLRNCLKHPQTSMYLGSISQRYSRYLLSSQRLSAYYSGFLGQNRYVCKAYTSKVKSADPSITREQDHLEGIIT